MSEGRRAAPEPRGTTAASMVRDAALAWGRWNFEQRVAAVASLFLIVSTFGPFSFVEAAIILIGLGVLWLLKSRADGKSFHLPFGDGTVIFVAGCWSAFLIVVRLFDRPLGQNLLALACAAVLALAGASEKAKRPADDLPSEPEPPPRPQTPRPPPREARTEPVREPEPTSRVPQPEEPTQRLPEPEPPPEFEPPPREGR